MVAGTQARRMALDIKKRFKQARVVSALPK
jgi:hypothetical protein